MMKQSNFEIDGTVLIGYHGHASKLVIPEGITEIADYAFENLERIQSITFPDSLLKIGDFIFDDFCEHPEKMAPIQLPPNLKKIGRSAFSGFPLKQVIIPKSVEIIERSAFFGGTEELIVYDTLDPKASEASDWKFDQWNGTVNSSLSCAMLDVPPSYVESSANTTWKNYHITVRSAETEQNLYRIFCDSKEKDFYRTLMFSAWGRHASFRFDLYDDYFMHTKNGDGRIEMAFCRMQYPYGMSEAHRYIYESWMERCLYIQSSAKRVSAVIAREDCTERLQLLHRFHAIDSHNIDWIRSVMEQHSANSCLQYLNMLGL